MPAPRKIEVRIGGNPYLLTTGDDEAYARRVATQAEQMVRRVQQANPALNQNAALVLSLVNAIDEGIRSEMRGEVLASRLEEAEGRVAEVRTEMLRFKERSDAAAAELSRIRTQLERAERGWLSGVDRPASPSPGRPVQSTIPAPEPEPDPAVVPPEDMPEEY